MDLRPKPPLPRILLEKLDRAWRRVERQYPRTAVLRQRIRLKKDHPISLPLGLVLLFPCIVIIVIIILFARHPDPGGMMNMPGGVPPSIRYVISASNRLVISGSDEIAEKSASSTIRCS